MTSAILVQCSTNWAIKPTGSWSLCEFYCRWRGIQVGVRKNIFEVQEGLEDLHSRLLVASEYLQIIWAALHKVLYSNSFPGSRTFQPFPCSSQGAVRWETLEVVALYWLQHMLTVKTAQALEVGQLFSMERAANICKKGLLLQKTITDYNK